MTKDSDALPNRIFVDLFGPLIDVEKLEPFKDIAARYLALDLLVAAVNAKLDIRLQGHWFPKIDQSGVLEICAKALNQEDRHPGLIDLKLLDALIIAAENGTQVVVVSTVPDPVVFRAAKKALKARIQKANAVVDGKIKFERTIESRKWPDILKEYKKREHRFTYVLHDTPREQLGVPEELVDVWVPGSNGDNLAEVINEALAKERRHGPLLWLRATRELKLKEFEALDGYVIHEPVRRRRVIATVKKLNKRAGAPTCVFLGGSPGSGKSYFVEKCTQHIAGRNKVPLTLNISGVEKIEVALQKHVNAILAEKSTTSALAEHRRKPTVAFIDEVDTEVFHNFAFRLLLSPMDGIPLTPEGFAMVDSNPGGTNERIKLENLIWFFAGSAGKTREDFRRLAEQDRKVADFMSRISYWIELPGTDSAFDAMFMAITLLKKKCSNLKRIEKKVLLLFANAVWRDARHLRLHVDNIVANHYRARSPATLAFKAVSQVLRDEMDLEQTIASVAKARLAGNLRVYD